MKAIYPVKYCELVEQNARKYGVEKEIIYAIIKCESGFDENAYSRAGAIGLMQITEDTFKWLQMYTHENLETKCLKQPDVNLKYGTLLIALLREKYDDDSVVLGAYNAGEATVKKWLKDSSISCDGKSLSRIPYKETNNYVKKVKAAKKIYKKLYF